MKLGLSTSYKSLRPFFAEISNFTILTGINGAGKTQILTAIAEKQATVLDDPDILTVFQYVPSQNLSPNDSVVATKATVNENKQKVWNQYNRLLENQKQNPAASLWASMGDGNSVMRRITEKVAKAANKDISKLEELDFYKHYPIEDGFGADIFYQNLSYTFKRYSERLIDNNFQGYLIAQGQQPTIDFLPEKLFVETYGPPPWEVVNRIIEVAGLDYEINAPNLFTQDVAYDLKLVNKSSQAKLKFSDLSSGERVLMSLALALYNSNFDVFFPQMLLLDEPDASLHPSMSKIFLDIIKKVLVNEIGVKVIMTTHSPSTVALAEEEALYVVNKSGERIEKITKDKALKVLTAGVPSFSINFENRRQVFVESPYDVKFYEGIYQLLSDRLIPEISLTFISSGESRTDKNGRKISNCEQVKSITNLLRTAGNNFVWGIIDWDGSNFEEPFVKVLGGGERYSIESYLFDPIVIAALVWREKLLSSEELGLEKTTSYVDFKHLSAVQHQTMVDVIIEKVIRHAKPSNLTNTRKVRLLNEIELQVPVWYLHYPGHDLEEVILKTFPKLSDIKRNKEDALKLEIIEKVLDDIPVILSKDFLVAFNSVQATD